LLPLFATAPVPTTKSVWTYGELDVLGAVGVLLSDPPQPNAHASSVARMILRVIC